MHDDFGGCMAIIGSMTQAIRAQKVLAKAAIRTDVVKADTGESRRGCVYALSYPCAQEANVRMILSRDGVRVRAYHGGNRDLS
ncbi:MAG: DUF3343 domain-containing protein [Clostridia bacterium]|nr:DUF3343 domain-containing protein [Clostridia bacterium]MBQ9774263.1 DUF3343 domain-containing protein [Clostridia bacterium]